MNGIVYRIMDEWMDVERMNDLMVNDETVERN